MAPRPDDADDAAPAPDHGPVPEGDAPGAGASPGADPGAGAGAHSGRVDDEQWADIVSRLAEVDSAAVARRDASPAPVTSDPANPADDRRTGTDDAWRAEADVVEPSGRDWSGTEQIDAAEDAVDRAEPFEPPDPGPVLGGDPLLTMAWLAVGGMPLFLLVVLIAWRGAPAALVQAAAVVFVIGIGVLLWRMPNRRDPGDDDGAVV
ncbi:hypothetical protein [Cellulomonas sp. HZM]|uniref:hypothetical protein n=1 Tax=Cellulomonas sp. HZM TaxID=1454010 RepID=UPI00068E4515|nr:hypothetical protein [Cellulomonas sp. HZM]